MMEIVASLTHSVAATSPAEVSWRQSMKTAIRDPDELCRILDLAQEFIEPARRAAEDFPLFAPRSYVARMQRGNPRDPLLLQVLPLGEEAVAHSDFSSDPVGDGGATVLPGLLHKYASRVLLITTGACAVHCRYCFRRHFPYQQGPRSIEEWQPAFEQIAADSSIHEVILSGGDPLTLSDHHISTLVDRLVAIPHLRRLRVHTRLPIIIPERVTPELVRCLRGSRLTPIFVVHANHPAELDEHVAESISKLTDAGIPLLNQAVLLRGINDDLDVLARLSERLVDLRVMPYYLHQLDRVQGAAHFEVPVSRGRALVEGLRRRLPGYAVPKYVAERPLMPNKTPLG